MNSVLWTGHNAGDELFVGRRQHVQETLHGQLGVFGHVIGSAGYTPTHPRIDRRNNYNGGWRFPRR